MSISLEVVVRAAARALATVCTTIAGLAICQAAVPAGFQDRIAAADALRREEFWDSATEKYSSLLTELGGSTPASTPDAKAWARVVTAQSLCNNNVETVTRIRDSVRAIPGAEEHAAHLSLFLAFLHVQSPATASPELSRQHLRDAASSLRGRLMTPEQRWLRTAAELFAAKVESTLDAQIQLAHRLLDELASDESSLPQERVTWGIQCLHVLEEAPDPALFVSALNRVRGWHWTTDIYHPDFPDHESHLADLSFKASFRTGRFQEALEYFDRTGRTNELETGIQHALCRRGLGTLDANPGPAALRSLLARVSGPEGGELHFNDVGSASLLAHAIGDNDLAGKLANKAIERFCATELRRVFLMPPWQRYQAFYRSRLQNLVCSLGSTDPTPVLRYSLNVRGIVERSLAAENAHAFSATGTEQARRLEQIQRLNHLGSSDALEGSGDTNQLALHQLLLDSAALGSPETRLRTSAPTLARGTRIVQFIQYHPPDTRGRSTNTAYGLLVLDAGRPARFLQCPPDLDLRLDSYFRTIAAGAAGSWSNVTGLSRSLVDLIGPLKGINHLGIVADGPLSGVGWASLPDPEGRGYWCTGRTVGVCDTLAVAGSTPQPVSPARKTPPPSAMRLVHFTPEAAYTVSHRWSEGRFELTPGPLPQLRLLVEGMAGARDLRVRVAGNLSPLFEPVEAELALVIAHGVVLRGQQGSDPAPTALVLPSPDMPADTVVTPLDVFRFGPCRTRRVVLGACWGARDDYFDGSDSMSFPSSLIGCGARSVISPGWPIFDAAGARYLRKFFEGGNGARRDWSQFHAEFLESLGAQDDASRLNVHQRYGAWQERRGAGPDTALNAP